MLLLVARVNLNLTLTLTVPLWPRKKFSIAHVLRKLCANSHFQKDKSTLRRSTGSMLTATLFVYNRTLLRLLVRLFLVF